jgi:hypothetical protein
MEEEEKLKFKMFRKEEKAESSERGERSRGGLSIVPTSQPPQLPDANVSGGNFGLNLCSSCA